MSFWLQYYRWTLGGLEPQFNSVFIIDAVDFILLSFVAMTTIGKVTAMYVINDV